MCDPTPEQRAEAVTAIAREMKVVFVPTGVPVAYDYARARLRREAYAAVAALLALGWGIRGR